MARSTDIADVALKQRGTPVSPGSPVGAPRRRRLVASPGGWVIWGAVIFFLLNLLGVIGSVVVNSFGKQWFNTWFPQGATTRWYAQAWNEFGLFPVIITTIEVCAAVVFLSLVIGVPASYVLARRDFPGKRIIYLTFLLPILMPPITYGIPLATVLYKFGLAGNISGVILANLVPSVPFVILTMTPFIEQVDPALERAARMCGANLRAVFLRILTPLLVPGILAAGILVLVRTVGMFELTFLTDGPDSHTLVVALFESMSSAGIRAQQSVDAMAVIYMTLMIILLVVALRFVNPTQLVARVKEEPDS